MRQTVILLAMAAALGAAAAAEQWQGYLMDSACAAKMKDKAAAHKAKCALSCSKGGYGLVTSDGKYLKFDEAGNAKALAALKKTSKDQDLTAQVTGTRDGDMIRVESITIP